MFEKKSNVGSIIFFILVSIFIRVGVRTYFQEKDRTERIKEIEKWKHVKFKSEDIMGYDGYISFIDGDLFWTIQDTTSGSKVDTTSTKSRDKIENIKNKIKIKAESLNYIKHDELYSNSSTVSLFWKENSFMGFEELSTPSTTNYLIQTIEINGEDGAEFIEKLQDLNMQNIILKYQ